MAGNILCRYYLRDGFCSKGTYCEFLHQNERPLCKFYFSSVGCRKGDDCTFLHRKNTKKSIRNKTQNNIKPRNDEIDSTQKIQTNIIDMNSKPTSESRDELWGLSNTDDSYFYGSVGTNLKSDNQTPQYIDILGGNSNYSSTTKFSQAENHTKLQSSVKQQTICPFFIYGSCMYGDNCKNIHSLDESGENTEEELMLMNEEIVSAKSAECGICLSLIEDKSIGMLSNCWCRFCLDCIRSWRKEGITIAKNTVRLCPLCRTESYFIIPCNRLIKDVTRKKKLVEEYKKSLAQIPCKHFLSNSCPFGTSCFYKHININGEIEITTPPRILITADESVKITSTPLLADYLSISSNSTNSRRMTSSRNR